MNEIPLLEEATFNFSQESNCVSENDGAEFLEILNTLLDYHIVDTNKMVMSEKPTDHKLTTKQ